MDMYKHSTSLLWGFLIIASRFSLCCYLVCQPAPPHLFVPVILRVLIHFQNLKKMNALFHVHVWWGRDDCGQIIEDYFHNLPEPEFSFLKSEENHNTHFTELLKEFNNAYKWLRVLAYYDVSVNGGFYLCHWDHHLYYCWKINKHLSLHPANLWDVQLLIRKSRKRE